ncbi:MAG TPA: dihydrolipoamide acetyltransferase family protein [Oceanipulchritudo sp.]|nr:dihydrolipoamide acetyltransferase family protein [Oceanipulchritudo sp.]
MAEIIEMPKLSDTMTTGTLVKWLKNEGDEVASGDMLAEVETDKATMEVETFEDGVVLKHYIGEGDSIAIGGPICAIGEKGEEAPEVEMPEAPDEEESDDGEEEEDSGDSKKEEVSAEDTEEATAADDEEEDAEEEDSEEAPESPSDSTPTPSSSGKGERIKISPLARKIAADLKVELEGIQGTGPGGRIVKADVEKAAKAPRKARVAKKEEGPAFTLGAIEEKSLKVSNMRASIAKALVKSKSEAPHFYLQSEVDAEALSKTRLDLNSFLAELPSEEGGIKYTVNDLILKAAAMAVLQVPDINRSWQGKKIQQHSSVHLAFGVAMDDGLVTPVIRDAQTKSLRQISIEARALIGKARNRKLKPEEMSGSTLTVTNLGMYGISDFYGILNPGNAAILSVGSTVRKPVVNEHDQIVVGSRMKVGLSGDHRVIDGAVGAQYLDALRRILEKPAILLA